MSTAKIRLSIHSVPLLLGLAACSSSSSGGGGTTDAGHPPDANVDGSPVVDAAVDSPAPTIDAAVDAAPDAAATVTLTMSFSGNGYGTVSSTAAGGNSLNVTLTKPALYSTPVVTTFPAGSAITLTAAPSTTAGSATVAGTASTFAYFNCGSATPTPSSSTTLALTMSGNITCVANFERVTGYAYVANQTGNTVSEYLVSSTGVFTANTATNTVNAGTGTRLARVHPNGGYVIVTNAGTTPSVSSYSINTVAQAAANPLNVAGKLTLVTTVTLAAGLTPEGVAFDTTGNYVLVAIGGTTAANSQLMACGFVQTSGALSCPTAGTQTTGVSPSVLAVNPQTGMTYLGYYSGATSPFLSSYSFDAGTFAHVSDTTVFGTGAATYAIAIEPLAGNPLFMTNYSNGTLQGFPITDAGLADASVIGDAGGVSTAWGLGFTPFGNYAIVGNVNAGTLSSLNLATNPPTLVDSITGLNTPKGLRVDRSGNFVAIVVSGSTLVNSYAISTNGILNTTALSSIATGTGPVEVDFAPAN